MFETDIPTEYIGLCFDEIMALIEEAAEEEFQAEKARREIPRRGQ
jgi:hypothetical protein